MVDLSIQNLEFFAIKYLLAAFNDNLERNADLFPQSSLDNASETLLSLKLFVKHSKSDIFDDGQSVKLIVHVNLLARDIDQKLVVL